MADSVSNGSAVKTSGSKRRNKKSSAVNTPDTHNPVAAGNTAELAEASDSINGAEKVYEIPHIREVQKNIRNVSKKLSGTAKVEAIVAENPGSTVDDLVAARKINIDQKAQIEKRPSLLAQLQQLEDQLALFKKLEDDFQARLVQQREQLETAHNKEIETLKTELATQNNAQADSTFRQKLLVLSKFLRAAAARRAVEEDGTEDAQSSEESKAFEGLLLLVYGGDNGAGDAAERLIEGSSDTIPSTEGEMLSVTYDKVKQLSLEYIPPYATEEAWANGVAEAQVQQEPLTDPTVANAGLTEAKTDMQATEPPAAGSDVPTELPAAPAQADTGDGAANLTAAQQWDTTADPAEEMEAQWVSVPRPADELEKDAATAAPNATENWADQPVENLPIAAAVAEPQADPSDGFREVHHGNNRGRGRGGSFPDQRGRGRGGYRGGDGRGRGYRGDRGGYRGRGRGGARGRGDSTHA